MAARKPKKVKSSLSRKYDTKYIGTEPDFSNVDFLGLSEHDQNIQLAHATNWYNYMYDKKKDFVPILQAYAKVLGWSKDKMSCITALSLEHYASYPVYMIRLSQRGLPLNERQQSLVDEYMKNILVNGKVAIAKRKLDASTPTATKLRKYDDQDDILYDLEYLFEDHIIENKAINEDFNLYERIRANKTSRKILNHYVMPWIESRIAEAKTLESKEKYGVRFQKKIVKAYESLLSDAERATTQPTRVAPIRIKKKTPAIRQIRDLKYKRESSEYKLVSVNPEKIVGAANLLVFNTKYRKLIWFTATASGFEISGSTIKNVQSTDGKTLRKPDEQLKLFTRTDAITKLTKAFASINSKGSEASPRLNDNCIILKAI